jgi:archaellum component FlaC
MAHVFDKGNNTFKKLNSQKSQIISEKIIEEIEEERESIKEQGRHKKAAVINPIAEEDDLDEFSLHSSFKSFKNSASSPT